MLTVAIVADVSELASAEAARPRVSLREIHGIVFGTPDNPTHVLVPGFDDAPLDTFPAWLDPLRAEGWQVTLTRALSFVGVLVDARHIAPR
jgi:hypothetical protein